MADDVSPVVPFLHCAALAAAGRLPRVWGLDPGPGPRSGVRGGGAVPQTGVGGRLLQAG